MPPTSELSVPPTDNVSMQRFLGTTALARPGPGPYPVPSSTSGSWCSSEPGWLGAAAIGLVPAVCVCCSSQRFLGRLPRASPHPQPGFTSPFRQQVEVWNISGLGLGCCFLICCCKRREKKKKKQPSGNVKQVAGAWRAERDRVEAEVGAGAGTPVSRPCSPWGPCSPGLEAHLCVAGVPEHRAPSWSLSLHVKHGDLSGGRCSGCVPRARTV